MTYKKPVKQENRLKIAASQNCFVNAVTVTRMLPMKMVIG
jgi:hypothetical protein